MRFGSRMRVRMQEVPPALAGLQVPRLILQPVIENYLKYGYEVSEEGGEFTVLFEETPQGLVITVGGGCAPIGEKEFRQLEEKLDAAGDKGEVTGPVSYTHLDVYKRQMQDCPPILDCGVHYMDIMRWISGEEIVGVSGRGCRLDPDASCINYGDVQVQLTGGCLGNYESGWSRNLKAVSYTHLSGEQGQRDRDLSGGCRGALGSGHRGVGSPARGSETCDSSGSGSLYAGGRTA